MEQLKNNAATALDGTITNSATSITVDDGSVFPTSGNFRLLCGSEIMLCTARSGNTLTVTRGHESVATTHNDNDVISLVFTKGSFEQLLAEYNQSGGYASRPSAPRKGTTYQATDLCNARWFYDGSGWNLIKPWIVPAAKVFNLTGWTAVNHGTSTFTVKNGILEGNLQINASNLRGYTRAIPTAPYKYTILIPGMLQGQGNLTWNLGFRENSTGKFKAIQWASGNPGQIFVGYWNTASSFNSQLLGVLGLLTSADLYLRIEDDNTNWRWLISRDGLNFTLAFSQARNTTFTADHLCIMLSNNLSYTAAPNLNLYVAAAWEGN